MKCKHHPQREAEQFCASCGIPICAECTEEANPGEYYCFQCAMFQTVTGVGSSIKEKREKVSEKELEKKKKWGPFHYFMIVSASLIVVMWGVILFGGGKTPGRRVDFTKNPRVLLFMVDTAIKRYAYYEGNRYPEKLSDLIPKHLLLKKENLSHLNTLSYQRDREVGYRLSFANPSPGGMNIVIMAKGIKHELPSEVKE